MAGEAETHSHACAVCGRVLDYWEKADGTSGWRHSIAAPAEDDHIAVPVPADQIQVRARCDFCYSDEVAWVVPAREIRFEVIGSPQPPIGGGGMDADWAACDPCSKLIDGNRWNALLERVKRSWEDRHGPMSPEVEAELKKLYRVLRKNITGALRPVEKHHET